MNTELYILEAELLDQKVVEIYNEIQPIVTSLRETITKRFTAQVMAADYRSEESQKEVTNFLNDWFRCTVVYKLGAYHFIPHVIELPKDLPPLLRAILLDNAVSEHIAAVKEFKSAQNATAPVPAPPSVDDFLIWKSYFGEPTRPIQIPEGYVYAGKDELPVCAENPTKDIVWFVGYDVSRQTWVGCGSGPWAIKVGSEIYYKNLEYIKSCPKSTTSIVNDTSEDINGRLDNSDDPAF